MKITYYGHSCLLVEGNGKRVIIDPFLSGNPDSGIKPGEVQVDAVILTHAHDDHFGDSLDIAKNNQCPIIAVFELAMYCAQKGAEIHPMNPGGQFSFDGFTVKMTPAFHSSSIREGDTYLYAGQPVGIILTMDGKTLYHAGDTALFGDMKLIGDLHEIDAAALPIGDNFTMGPKEAVVAAHWVKAKNVIPIHYNTFPVIKQDPAKFVDELAKIEIRGHALNSRQSIEI
jgi:L-ascorbate metabolism protein UlaG (beta-lactamase superfamily)